VAKDNDRTTRKKSGTERTTSSGARTADVMERRVVVFAEHLGRIAGTLQAKAAGWTDHEALTRQLADIRDTAADLLEQLAGRATVGATKQPSTATGAARTKGRSGGVVDAPGKTHRQPMPADPGAPRARSQAAKVRAARTMVKTNRRRGRG
jgi:hypothetical protein